MFLLQGEKSAYAFESAVVVLSAHLLPLSPSFVELVGSDLSDDEVDLHQPSLLDGEVLVGQQLLVDSLAELVPVEVAYEIFELLFVYLIGFLECVHVYLYEVLMPQSLGQNEP